MPFERGGLADKLGNRYEGHWVVKQLLALLNEEIRSVTIEAIGDDERGVDLWVEDNNGIRQAQQCKARNASRESWTIGDLNSRGILSYLQFQLERDSSCQFALISSIGFELFKDICNFARRSDNNPELFYQYKILKAGKEVRTCFQKICSLLDLDHDNSADLQKVFDYLKRTSINIYPDDQNAWKELLGKSGYLLTGDPESNISLLVSYAENHDKLSSRIYTDELREYLAEHKIYPKKLSHDKRIVPAVNELQSQFSESIRPLLIRDKPLQRQVTSQLFENIKENKNVIVHGAAGYGKSGVLYELTQHFRQNNIPYLPIRLDRKEPKNTAVEFGKDLGLPDCPAHCLTALAGDRQAVLILDQLDALRWTSAHTNNALDVCKELLRRIQSLRLSGKKISIVLSCRTYDLEHDPEIRNWLSGNTEQKFGKIVVRELDQKTLQRIAGSSYSVFTGKEKQLLACPQNLAMWLKIRDSSSITTFASATELIRTFWENRRLVLDQEAGISPEQMDAVLNPLIDFMERKGKISAPKRIVSSNPKTIKALKSYGILQEEASRYSFCHQRYLDFLIAGRLLLQIDQATGRIIDWLGPKEQQSLFRREQLRQALVMLSEESPSAFLSEAMTLLEAESIRFHFKHLVLELLGLQETVTNDLYYACFRLFSDDFWKDHILETVFLAHAPFVKSLIEKQVISEWIDSGNEEQKQHAFMLLRSVNEKLPDLVAKLLEPLVDDDEEHQTQVLHTLPWKLTDNSEKSFQLRLKLTRMGCVNDFVDWKSLCSKHPLWSIRLIEAVLSSWKVDDEKKPQSSQKGRLEKWYDQDSKALYTVAREYPVETWKLLLPQIDRLTSIDEKQYDYRLEDWKKEGSPGQRHTDIARGVVELTIRAGQQLAVSKSDVLILQAKPWNNSTSPIIREILVEAYTHLPPSHAEKGILWLLSDNSRFALGHGYSEPKWKPAARLIENLSPHCSKELFQQLEEAIVNYHAPDEKQKAEYCLSTWHKGYFRYFRGQAQHFLLPALDQTRVSPFTKDYIRVLARKFASYSTGDFLLGGEMSGGTIGSKLYPNLERISDRAWLEIVSNKKIPEEWGHNWLQVDPETVLETSVQQFAGSLATMAKRFPQRFGELALRFPDHVNPAYVSSILDGLALSKPDSSVPDDIVLSWQPGSVKTIEGILNKFKSVHDRQTAASFCRLISNRAEQNWSTAAIVKLLDYTGNQPNPKLNQPQLSHDKSENETPATTFTNSAFNYVRECAARAITQLLWHDYNWFERLRPGIESLVHDPHSSVRMAAIEPLSPVLNINKDLAVALFCQACAEDAQVAADPRGRHFFNHVAQTHHEQITPVIQRMIHSSQENVAQEGALQVTARWIFHGFFEQELEDCRQGTVSHRKGVAQAAAQLFSNKEFSHSCQKLLLPLLNDPEREVRDECFHIFRKRDYLMEEQLRPFMMMFITSQAFCDSPGRFVAILKNTTGSLLPLSDTIFTICEVFTTTLQEKACDFSTSMPHNVSEILSVLLRLYEQASNTDNTELTNRCLDILDMLFQNRIGIINDLMKTIEQ